MIPPNPIQSSPIQSMDGSDPWMDPIHVQLCSRPIFWVAFDRSRLLDAATCIRQGLWGSPWPLAFICDDLDLSSSSSYLITSLWDTASEQRHQKTQSVQLRLAAATPYIDNVEAVRHGSLG